MDTISSIKNLDYFSEYISNIVFDEIEKNIFIVAINGEKKFLIKIFPIELYESILYKKKKIDKLIEKNINIYPILDMGTMKEINKAYKIIDYIDTITRFESEDDNYKLGYKIGKIIRNYHLLSNKIDNSDWVKEYNHKINILFHEYYLCDYIGNKDYIILDFIKNNKYLLSDRDIIEVLSFKDIRKIPVDKNGKVFLFDIGEREEADPYFEFKGININYYKDEAYSAGIIDGYFGGKPSRIFFKVIALYTLVEALGKEFEDFKKVNCDIARLKTTELLGYYNGLEDIYPCWYINIKEKLKRNTDENTR